ncbi:GumC family protein [Chlorogloea sp. CCALA 695]|uniref:GumC family protein n=1 Tax=Chlorogloea sp. CCALA 695 TaxID=2107693 RepID=UPI000D07200B|nr:polysaccharide biosynthesis tyrosine autokinase [Chlorogloea sp. CCALA 695]PSB29494.1 lipopolysaccharide biosynthesis protein [Chlorogloea sp. CCALA 695]
MEAPENIQFYNYWCIFKRHWLPALAIFSTITGGSYLYTSAKTPIYSAQGQILFKQDKTSSLIGLDSDAQAMDSQSNSSLNTESRLILSENILRKILDIVNENSSQKTPLSVGDLQAGLEVINIEGTDILQVTYKSNNPEIASLVVNQLMNVYVNRNLLGNRAAAISAGNFITSQLPKVKANVYNADAAIRKFKEKYKLTDLAQTQRSVAENIERIGSQVDSIEAQLSDLNSRSKGIQQKLGMSPQEAIVTASVSQSSAVQGVIKELQEVQRKLANARSLYKDDHPIIVQFKEKEAQLNILLNSETTRILQGQKISSYSNLQVGSIQQDLITTLTKLEIDRLGLITQKTTLLKQQAFYQKKAATLPELQQQQGELERQLLASQSTYETLLKSLQEIKVKENRTVGNVQIVEYAEIPVVATNASNKSSMIAASLAGILVAGAVVYFLELTDKKIKTVKEARELFDYRLLGTIPIFNKIAEIGSGAVPVIEDPRAFISESYRMLQFNLEVASSKALKVIAITSSVPNEGKSTTCANLAAVMAQLEHKVLIIDADFRHPSQHLIWQISNEEGLMNVIAEKVSFSDRVIQTVRKNLDVITTGESDHNQNILLDSRKMGAFINQCPKQYDYVIIDTPPLAISADANILGKFADGVILVTRPGVADTISSKVVKERLDQSGQNILGIVINGVFADNKFYRYYHAESEYEVSGSKKHNNIKKLLGKLKFFNRS